LDKKESNEMKDLNSKLDDIIKKTKNGEIEWEFNKKDSSIVVYDSIIPITNEKHIFLAFTKRKLSNNKLNFYLEIYITSKTGDNHYSEFIPENKSYYYTRIASLYVTRFEKLIELYSFIKFNNFLNLKVGKEEYALNLYKWTEDNKLIWYKKDDNYICFDTNISDIKLYIMVLKNNNIFIELIYNDNIKKFINFIDNRNINLYKLIDEKNKNK